MAPQPPQPPAPPQEGGKKKDDKDEKDEKDDKDDKGGKPPPPPAQITPPIVPAANTYPETTMVSPLPPPVDGQRPTNVPGARPEAQSSGFARPPDGSPVPTTATQSAFTLGATPYAGGLENQLLSMTPTTIATPTQTPDQPPPGPIGGRPPDWNGPKGGGNHAPLYAAAAVVPVVVLCIFGVVAFLCLRRRKKRRVEAAFIEAEAKEMKLEPEEPKGREEQTVRRYMAPPPAALPSEEWDRPPSELRPTSLWSQTHPIILGPIGSGSNGAYLTGMDTSDMVSITSNSHRPVDPFADNSSFAEPPPPYRPHSSAPPSFMSTSRQSSLRMSVARANSRARFVARSPFDDPLDDAVSELSGPTIERDDDSMSAVSRLSYQRDPFMGRHMR